jgi:hypothetical protein
MPPRPVIRVIRPGDTTKPDPFTVCVVANPALEAPWKRGQFVIDLVTGNQSGFDDSVRYVEQALFGMLPGQAETFLGDPAVGSKVRLVSVFAQGLPADDASSLVAEDAVSDLLVARRTRFAPFLARFGLAADVVYAISQSPGHVRASAWFTSDDDARPGVRFVLDGAVLHHRFHNLIPGTIAQHVTKRSLTALHEFGHALSSYTNGKVVDLYVDGPAGVNNKRSVSRPTTFAVYRGTTFATDGVRDGLGYPPQWKSYHCELHDPGFPAVMDRYGFAAGGMSARCQHDRITRRFLLDRVRAKQSR